MEMSPPLYGDVPTLYGDVPTLYGDVPTLYGDVPTLYGDVPTLYGDVPTLYGDVPTLYGDVPTLYMEMSYPVRLLAMQVGQRRHTLNVGQTWTIPQRHPTPHGSKRRSRWDETPASQRLGGAGTPLMGATPTSGTPAMAGTPELCSGNSSWGPGDADADTHTWVRVYQQYSAMSAGLGVEAVVVFDGHRSGCLVVPAAGVVLAQDGLWSNGHMGAMTPEQMQAWRWEMELDERNRPLTDEELDALFPQEGYKMDENKVKIVEDLQPSGSNLPYMKIEDTQYFSKLLEDIDEEQLPPEEQKERTIMRLLLKIKNGTPPMRKSALRQITDKAREFGADALFNQILPLLMSPTLEDQERHLLVKVIDRILYKLDDLVRPYVHKILVVIEPLLIDEDYYARVEGREIISNLAKAAGLATMISTMRPDIDNMDEYVRNTTASRVQEQEVLAGASHRIKIVQQIAILMGCAVLPHLKSLVEIVDTGLVDEQQKVRTITALALAALAEAATPYGIEAFDSVLVRLWKGIRAHRGKGLAAFLKAIGYLIPLMDNESANYYYTREVMVILIREFQSPDEEMKKIVLKVVKQCCMTDGVEPQYIKEEILPHFFRHSGTTGWLWTGETSSRWAGSQSSWDGLGCTGSALSRSVVVMLTILVDTTVEIANKVGGAEIVSRIVEDLKDENEQYRKMVMDCTEKVLGNLGAADVDSRLEEQLIDGILYAFQEQTNEDAIMLNGFGVVVNSLGVRVKPYLPQICGTILWRLNNKAAKVRQQAADLISRIASVMHKCGEEKLLGHLGVVLYEYLGEEYPEVLGSILAGLKDLLPRLTPILKNRHEKVQENCIDLPTKKAIRRATVNTFGYIAKAIGCRRDSFECVPTVAIAIARRPALPSLCSPGLMNEYRVPELNVQNGVPKSLSFLFEYIGEMGKDYIYAVTPLLEDALMDRLAQGPCSQQTASWAVKHMALGSMALGSFNDAVDGLRVALGPSRILQYTLQVTMWAVFKKACWSLHALFGVWYRDSSTQQGNNYITSALVNYRLATSQSSLLSQLVMNSSSVLIVHPSADRFRLSSDMSNGKLGRHYSLDSPSLTSPPGYDPLMDSKAVSIAMSHPNSSVHMGTAHQFSSFNPQFVMAQSGCAPPSLLHINPTMSVPGSGGHPGMLYHHPAHQIHPGMMTPLRPETYRRGGKQRRHRTNFTTQQLEELEKAFEKTR
eukprot:Em0404g2a